MIDGGRGFGGGSEHENLTINYKVVDGLVRGVKINS
jgi:hypothetical protein